MTQDKQQSLPEADVLELLRLLPSVKCLSPKQVFQAPSLSKTWFLLMQALVDVHWYTAYPVRMVNRVRLLIVSFFHS